MSITKEKLNKIPNEPGVYIFKDSVEKILYIGKATNLRSRVGSYFRGTETRNHIEAMMPKVADIKFIQTDSVLEALILESNLIKKHQPKYNIDLKDDKSFAYFVITKEKFSRILIFRATEIDFGKLRTKNYKLKTIFGPYTSKKQMEIALKIIRKIFPFHSNKQDTEKGCLDFQLGLCPGSYADEISQKDYQKNINGIRMILEGKKKSLVKKLEKEMQIMAKEHEFEKAAEIRNKIFALQHIRDVALISKDFNTESNVGKSKCQNVIRIEAYDISNISGQQAVGSMVVFENGEPSKKEYRKFKIKTVIDSDDVGMMREVLLRRFQNNWPASTRGNGRSSTRGWSMPNLILLDGGQGHLNMAKKLLQQELGLNLEIVAVAKGIKRKKLDLRFGNYDLKQEIKSILNNKNLIKYIMDEAHRFAISYHRKLRKASFLDKITKKV